MTNEYGPHASACAFPETADIETATAEYAGRFSGPTGQWLLNVQADGLRKSLKDLGPGRALDVGGGHAQTAPVLAECGLTPLVTGSAESCAERLPAGTEFVLADHLALPFEDQSFEAVISFRLLPHCERWRELIPELCRVAKHRVVVDYPARVSVNLLAESLFSLKKNVEKTPGPSPCFHIAKSGRPSRRRASRCAVTPSFSGRWCCTA